MTTLPTSTERVAIREGLFAGALDALDRVQLAGSSCNACGEVHLGTVHLCPNCGNGSLTSLALHPSGTLWTYTILRFKPPGDFRGSEPFKPRPCGLVELPDGVRVLAPLDIPEEDLVIGMHVRLRASPLYMDDADREVIAFSFAPAEEPPV